MLKKIFLITIFLTIGMAFIANPAPVTFERHDFILLALPFFIGLISLPALRDYTAYQVDRNLMVAILFYLIYLLYSLLIGLINGVALLQVLRGIGPYINFLPLAFIGFTPIRYVNPWALAIILILVGLGQGIYQIGLYFQHSHQVINTLDVLRGRITILEPRTSLPMVISLAILPLAFLTSLTWNKHFIYRILAIGLVVIGLFASIVTLTRSIILSIIFGWLFFAGIYLYQQAKIKALNLNRLFFKLVCYSLIIFSLIVLISTVPKIRLLEQGILARFTQHHSTGLTNDYSNGRLYNEWLPALNTWSHGGPMTLLFGIGAGNSFKVASGEERTYIHNLFIYSLVYGGIVGLSACLWLYFTLIKTFIIRSLQTQQTIYLGLAALLASLFFYAQLFAVHKGLAYNAMFFLIIGLALIQPQKITDQERKPCVE